MFHKQCDKKKKLTLSEVKKGKGRKILRQERNFFLDSKLIKVENAF